MDTQFDLAKGSFNQLFSRVTPLVNTIVDPPHPPLQKPKLGTFVVEGIFSDLKREVPEPEPGTSVFVRAPGARAAPGGAALGSILMHLRRQAAPRP